MFIRKTHILNRVSKKSYWNYQLVESTRTERGPRQRILLNLGTDLDLGAQERKDLANRIEEILKGISTILTYSDKVEAYAQKYTAQLREQLEPLDRQRTPCDILPVKESDPHTVDTNSMDVQEPGTVGVEHLLLHTANQLGLPDKLKALGFSQKEVALALGTIIGRATFPASERSTHAWLCRRSGVGELIDFNFQDTSLHQLYKISDQLLAHKESLEQHLGQAQQQVHGLRSTISLYDLSNTYMEGRALGNPKARYGLSKEKRGDCPLVTLGLVVDEHGFAKRTAFLPGNISEPSTLEQAIQYLDQGGNLFKPIIVLDAGIATDDNLSWLRKHKFPYVVSARQKAPSRELVAPLVPVEAATSQVKVAFIKTDSIEEQWLYCESEAKEIVATQMKTRFRERLEEDLRKLAAGLQKPRGRKKYVKVLERVGRLREKHKAVSGCYDITVEPSADGASAVNLRWISRPEKLEERLHGHYFLRTNLIEIAPEALWHLYNNLRTVEDAFRFMKSSLGMRPVYHKKEQRVDAHLWITVLGYHLIHSCMHKLQKHGINDHWETLRNTLSTRMRVTVQLHTTDNKVLRRRCTTQMEVHQQKIYRAMELSPQILKAKQSIV